MDRAGRLSSWWKPALLLTALIITAQWPRLWLSPSADESGQFNVIKSGYGVVATRYFYAQNHPFYGLVSKWFSNTLPLDRLVGFRIPALAAGVVLIVAFYWQQQRQVSTEAALLAAICFSYIDSVYHYSSVGRGYTMLMLGTLLANELLFRQLDRFSMLSALGYASVITLGIYTHLWMLLLVGSHGLVVLTEWQMTRRRATPITVKQVVAMGLAIAAGVAAAGMLYWPMLSEIKSMLDETRHQPIAAELLISLLQLLRAGSFTVGIYLVLTPILLSPAVVEVATGIERRQRTHGVIIIATMAATLLASPNNFGVRFLVIMIPSFMELLALQLGRRLAQRRFPLWSVLLGAALGLVVAWAPDAHEIPPSKDSWPHFVLRKGPMAFGPEIAVGLTLTALLLARRPAARHPLWLTNGLSLLAIVALLPVMLAWDTGSVTLWNEWHLYPLFILGLGYWSRQWWHDPWQHQVLPIAAGLTASCCWAFQLEEFPSRAANAICWGHSLLMATVLAWITRSSTQTLPDPQTMPATA